MPSTSVHLLHAQIGQVLTPLYTSLAMLLPDLSPHIIVRLMLLHRTMRCTSAQRCYLLEKNDRHVLIDVHKAHAGMCLMHINQCMFVFPLKGLTQLG